MPTVTLNSNSASLGIQRRLGESTSRVGQSFERLSSGLRINRAKDDAAGLSVAAGLNVDRRVYAQGVRNINDGINALEIASGALSALQTIQIRQKELAEQSANGVYSRDQRLALDLEAQALAVEYNRIVHTTQFNGIAVLGGGLSEVRVQHGYGLNEGLVLSVGNHIRKASGDGTVGDPTLFAGGTGDYNGIAAADFNLDGYLDIVTILSTSRTTFLGGGDGTFSTIQSAPGSTGELETADINLDGTPDLITRSAYRRGIGDGTFAAATGFAGSGGKGLRVGDVNNDGHQDVVTRSTGSEIIYLNISNGNATFAPAVSYATGGGDVGTVDLGDVDNDGDLDVLALDRVLFNNGSGQFNTSGPAGLSFFGSMLEDVNDDGNLDAISAHPGLGVRVELGNGTGGFNLVYANAVLDGGVQEAMTTADFNSDGIPDLVIGNLNVVRIAVGSGDGTFQTPYAATLSASPNVRSVETGDVNGDGVTDLIAGTTGGIEVFLGNVVYSYDQRVFSLKTAADARSALDTLTNELANTNAEIGSIGAQMSALEVTASRLESYTTELEQAESRIVDADIAEEAANLMKNRILQQAGAAILSQANQLPALALRLLAV